MAALEGRVPTTGPPGKFPPAPVPSFDKIAYSIFSVLGAGTRAGVSRVWLMSRTDHLAVQRERWTEGSRTREAMGSHGGVFPSHLRKVVLPLLTLQTHEETLQ